MKHFLFMALAGFLICSCSGSGNNSGSAVPPQVPTATVKGVAHDNILIQSTISAYRYTNGQIGQLLGTATTDNNGNYSITIQAEDTPILLEATGGSYIEEASKIPVNLKDGQKLRAVANYKTGTAIDVSVTTFTHLAAGLAAYRIGQGTGAAAAIDSANHDVSSMIGFNIITTKPLDITNSNNATAFVTNGHLYGFMSAAISSWTMFASIQNGQTSDNNNLHSFYNSILFAQQLYNDIVADGLLDGKGFNTNGQLVPLSFGVVPLSTEVYRHALAAHLLKISANKDSNKTGLTTAHLRTAATAYATKTDAIYGTATPIDFTNDGVPQVVCKTFTGCVLAGTPTFTATINSPIPVASATISVDGTAVASSLTTLSYALNTYPYEPGTGSWHTVSWAVLDGFGINVNASKAYYMVNSFYILPGGTPTFCE